MRLYDISPEAREQGVADCEVASVTDETAKVGKNDIFVCIKGKSFDGHDAAKEMLEKGAAAVVTEQDLGLERQIIVTSTRKYFSVLASRYYGEPTKRLKLIAATGTNGKSTIVNIIRFMLTELGHKTGCIGTVGYDVCGKIYEAHLTTPRPMQLYSYFREMADNGAEYCVLEASSQALAQYRLYGERFEAGIFTNLTQDHLDFHGTMENYYKAKKMLFKSCARAIVCVDDKYGERLARELEIPVTTYSVKDHADVYSVNIKVRNSGVSYWLSSCEDEKSFPVDFKIPGAFNVGNSMAAVAVCRGLGFSINDCVNVIQRFSGVSGRSEVIWDGAFTVLCDYAHTPDALLKFLTSVKSYVGGRIICVFGAAGERDETKRAEMGKIVSELTDYAVITSDNPRFEDPQKIISQVEAGFGETPYKTFIDRREAIEHALSEAKKGDLVALCGKGHETYQVIGDDYMHFSEKEIVKEIMGTEERKS